MPADAVRMDRFENRETSFPRSYALARVVELIKSVTGTTLIVCIIPLSSELRQFSLLLGEQLRNGLPLGEVGLAPQ